MIDMCCRCPASLLQWLSKPAAGGKSCELIFAAPFVLGAVTGPLSDCSSWLSQHYAGLAREAVVCAISFPNEDCSFRALFLVNGHNMPSLPGEVQWKWVQVCSYCFMAQASCLLSVQDFLHLMLL